MAPPALPGFLATMTLSEAQAGRRPRGCVRSHRRLRASSPDADHLLDVPCSLPRWVDGWYFSVSCAAPRAGSSQPPHWPSRSQLPVGTHGSTFRGLLKLHSRYGPSICSPTRGGLGRKASTPPVPRRRRFSATQAYRYPPEVGLPPTGVPRCKSARRVEERRGVGGHPFPFPAHQTGRADFQHPAFRQSSHDAHAGARRRRRITPSSPNIIWDGKRRVPTVECPVRWRRKFRTRRST